MRESTQKEVLLPDIPFNTLSQLLEFMYTDEISLENSDYNDVIKLLQAADRFAVANLKNLCEEQLITAITIDNVCQLLDCADKMNSYIVRSTCKQWIMGHFGDVLKSDYWMQLDKELVLEINREAANIHFSPPQKKAESGSHGKDNGNTNNNANCQQ